MKEGENSPGKDHLPARVGPEKTEEPCGQKQAGNDLPAARPRCPFPCIFH